jgi:hypothetical protein
MVRKKSKGLRGQQTTMGRTDALEEPLRPDQACGEVFACRSVVELIRELLGFMKDRNLGQR